MKKNKTNIIEPKENLPSEKNTILSVSEAVEAYPEELTNKQFYQNSRFFLDLNSYPEFFSKDLANLINYICTIGAYFIIKKNKISFITSLLGLFDFKLIYQKNRTNEEKIQIFIKFIIKLFRLKKKVKFEKDFFVKNNISSIFSYISEKSIFIYKNPIFIIELLIPIFSAKLSVNEEKNLEIEKYKIYVKILQIIHKHTTISSLFIKYIYYFYLLKKELTSSEFFTLKKKNFLNDSLLVFRKQIIEKATILNKKIQAKIDFRKNLEILENIRLYFRHKF